MKRVLLSLCFSLFIVGLSLFFCSEENSSLQSYKFEEGCRLQFKNGHFESQNIEEECPQLGSGYFSASISQLTKNEDFGFSFLKKETDQERWFLIALDEERVLAKRELSKKPENLTVEDGLIEINEVDRYLFTEDGFIEIKNEFVNLDSPKYGFSIRVPVNWNFENTGTGYRFEHNEMENYFLEINPNQINFNLAKGTEYEKELKKIKESISFNRFEDISDYSFFKEDLEKYLKIDTAEKEIIYQGEERYLFNILASGDPKNWNGTPGGLYRILSKEGLRFSTETEVFMPFSMRIYGKYLIHGEAYYPSGEPYTSMVSGGCVRVKNEKMKDLYELVEVGTPVLSVTHKKEEFNIPEVGLEKKPEVAAENFLVVDVKSGKIFAGKDYQDEVEITGLTKLMTAIIAVEQMGLTTPLTVRDYMLGSDDTNAKIKDGQEVRLIDLLAPMLVESSDNAARVLSHYLGRDNTLQYIRDKAVSIGMQETNFRDSAGVSLSTTTAKDLYYLLYYLKNTREPILDITKANWVPYLNYEIFQGLKNKNVFYQRDSFIGGMFEVGKESHNGIFLFEKELGGEKRNLAFIMLGVPTEGRMVKDIDNLKVWLEKSFN